MRQLIVLVSILTLVIPSTVLAEEPATRFEPSPIRGNVDPQILPIGIDDSRAVTVMLELEGQPVAVVESQAPGKELSRERKNAVQAELKARQDALKDDIAARGGQVLSQMQFAYNGMRVQVARSDVPALAALPGVVAVHGLQVHTIDNAVSVPFLGVPGVWEDLGFTGTGVKVAIIDTGIDYTHANFGGPGTVAAYEAADAADVTIGDAGDAGFFGAVAPKVKGGYDFVGDDYDASAAPGSPALIPHEDPDPLDCNGHGSHVAGSAAGFGVLADGTQYGDDPAETYDSSTHENDFTVGPGVAPQADLYALRVFGCEGSTDVTVEAIDWAVENDMDVINMSLGSPFGRSNDPSAVASTNAAAAGVIVVASAGNSGQSPYITGSPATGTGAISVAAVDSTQTFPGINLALNTGQTITAINANAAEVADGTTLDVVVLTDDPATTGENEALGCSVPAYERVGVVGKLAVTVRGDCARVARAVYGQQAGAAAVAMINSDVNYPPFEGPITSNPDTGESYDVTIPFLGIRGVLGPAATQDGDLLVATASATLTNASITNPGFMGFASFSSGGPRNGDSALKPDIAAPGVSIQSTASGTGNEGTRNSGTSMSSPHVAGVAALVQQAHPDWDVDELKAAIVNTGNPDGMVGYKVTRAGTGLVTPAAAVSTQVVALGDNVAGDGSLDPALADFHNSNLSFGFAELGADFVGTKTITLRNHGAADATYGLTAAASTQSRPATVTFSAGPVTIPAGGQATVDVTLTVPAATVGSSAAFREVSGNVVLTADGAATLRVPYLLVPRALSTVTTQLNGPLSLSVSGQTATVTNPSGVVAGAADFYAWGLQDADDANEAVLGGAGYDLRAVGVQSFDFGGGEQLIVFAVNNHDRWSTAATNEYDILVDTSGDGAPDYAVVGVDFGAVTTGNFDGRVGSFVFDLNNGGATIQFLADAPTDSSTLLLPVLSSQLGLTATSGPFTYSAVSFSLEGAGADPMPGTAKYDPYDPGISNGQFEIVAPGGSVTVKASINPTAYAKQKPLGLMVVTTDNAAGAAEAQLIEVPGKRKGR